ncbi:PAS domain-containing protein [Flavobacteriaceae bacterium 3-367]|uniref:PAS domain-containing protein n=1 Tax=Eudoraea algarum TaxID=3417568 RepID=UPI00328F19C0
MDEIKAYDEAANTFYRSRNITALPLVSWDLFGPYFNKLCKDAKDICGLNRLAQDNQWSYTGKFDRALTEKEHVIVVTDVELNIVYATHNISKMNGYPQAEIMGKKPKMFQGKDTCKDTARYISKAVRNKLPFEATLLNYRKNGEPYNCWIKGEPIFDGKGKLVNFIAYEREVA